MTQALEKRSWNRPVYTLMLFLATGGLSALALLTPYLAPLAANTLSAGQVASQDVRAPVDVTYESQVRTQLQRENAAGGVSSIYTAPDTSVARRQLEHLRTTLTFITSVRADTHATREQKLADLAALDSIHLSQETANEILDLGDSRWQAVQQEAIVVLEQVMRGTIREDRLDDVRRNIPTMVSLSLPEDQTALVAELVSAFVAPNSLYSEDLTQAAREKAMEAIPPVSRSFKAGETVVQRGQVITETDLEALQVMGLVQPQYGWKEIASASVLVLVSMVFLVFYLRRNPRLARDLRGLTVNAVLLVLFLAGAQLSTRGNPVIPYIFPLAAYSMTVAVLFGQEAALISSLPLAVMAAYGHTSPLELTLYYMLSGFFGVLSVGRARRITDVYGAAAAVAAVGAIVITIYRLPQASTGWMTMATLGGAALLYGISSAGLTVLLQFFLAQFLGMTTALQLVELSRPDHPLLQQILRSAPGTYQHSLQVANLAEQAAERIDADALLTRVGALYHDAGKTLNPIFFIENQAGGGTNPHDNLDPYESSQIIVRHVPDGLDLARKFRLPRRIQDFISEHHGTMVTRYQYIKAVEKAGSDEEAVEEADFRYPGPRPGSRETAILMLADGSEARVRAGKPSDAAELRAMIESIVKTCVDAGQLYGTDLTLKDLDQIVDSFTATLRGIYHPRIEYPKLEAKETPLPAPAIAPSIDPTPTVPASREASSERSPQAQPDSPSAGA